jgi:hypothetical protein
MMLLRWIRQWYQSCVREAIRFVKALFVGEAEFEKIPSPLSTALARAANLNVIPSWVGTTGP